ncbi:EpsG family protein [Pectobacterium versatile]|uniref:EpsG family protein n=1 Tax=Pectobacterium versatile TaxID=2488639 RepID=UPI001B359A4B|nr:EpsG family protein [Pectobacterium versatile]MBQ4776526.1 hypothetical protein [Pectobacterium versatile]
MKKSNIANCFFLFIGTILILCAGLRPVGLDRDSSNYIQILHISLKDADFFDKEPGFWFLNELNNLFFNGDVNHLFIMFSVLGVSLKLLAIRKLSLNPVLSVFLYITLYFILHEMTQMRVGVASGLFLLGLYDLCNDNKKSFFLKISIATLFHYSAILGFLVLFFDKKKINKIFYTLIPLFSVLVSAIFDTSSFVRMTSYILPGFIQYKLELYSNLLKEGEYSDINIFNFYYISLLFFYLFFVFISDKTKSSLDILLIKIFGAMMFSFYAFTFLPVVAFRVSEFLGIVIIILMANAAKWFKIESRFIYILIIVIWGMAYFISQGIMKNLNFEALS